MMPLTLAEPGRAATIAHIGGSASVRQHLNNLGFVVGNSVSVVNTLNGNLIVAVLDARIAISREMAGKILITI